MTPARTLPALFSAVRRTEKRMLGTAVSMPVAPLVICQRDMVIVPPRVTPSEVHAVTASYLTSLAIGGM